MDQIIKKYIKKQLDTNDDYSCNKIYNFLVNDVKIKIEETIVYKDELIYESPLVIPSNFKKNGNLSDIDEYHNRIKFGNLDVNINLGIDWIGIRSCGDKYCYFIRIGDY